jgi:hypothetical protein
LLALHALKLPKALRAAVEAAEAAEHEGGLLGALKSEITKQAKVSDLISDTRKGKRGQSSVSDRLAHVLWTQASSAALDAAMASGDSQALADAIFRANVNLVDKDTTRRATEQLQLQLVSVA